MKKNLPAVVTVALLLITWEVTAQIIARPDIFPGVSRLFATLGELFVSVSFYQSVATTILRGCAGILLSFVTACGSAILLSRYQWLYEGFRPILAIMRSIPVISFILLALIYLHPEGIPLIIAFLVMFPLLAENVTKGILQLHPGYKAIAQVFLIKGKNKLFQIYYPQLKPFLFSGLASAVGFGWRAIIMGEVLSQCESGIGSEMKRAQVFIEVPELMAWTIIAIIVSFIFDKGIRKAEQIKIPFVWSVGMKEIPVSNSGIRMECVGFSYPDKQVFSNYSHIFSRNKIYGISAPSGKGKTTLLNLINGILQPSGGDIQINRDYGTANVFQEPELLPYLSVMENTILPLTTYKTQETAIKMASHILKTLDIYTLKDSKPDELSYGQQQRTAIARALAFDSPFLLMDEPFKGFEPELTNKIIPFIRERQKATGQTILFTSHNQNELRDLADNIIHL
ncbi:MAG: ATP-binding cassette domain-containing protein [Tannerellaceae bacterium]|jgi:ABC-type nitrate/sulfonate/bicarbonate transport system ATPase subunit/ABC-type nitrate/sulfonate/bicarbonate transport system permease component|nr:ATP-binding cassette domain-containing protein [Tannerellaceae bacterium]